MREKLDDDGCLYLITEASKGIVLGWIARNLYAIVDGLQLWDIAGTFRPDLGEILFTLRFEPKEQPRPPVWPESSFDVLLREIEPYTLVDADGVPLPLIRKSA